MTERRIGDDSVVSAVTSVAGSAAAGLVDPGVEAAVGAAVDAAGRAGRAPGRAAGFGFFVLPFAAAAGVGLTGLRDAAEPAAAADGARRAALDRAAAELPPGPRRCGVDGSDSASTCTRYQQDKRASLTAMACTHRLNVASRNDNGMLSFR
jgi:hypothetical protein